MSKQTLFCLTLLLNITCAKPEASLKKHGKKWFKEWFDASFGIDINEQLIEKQFSPTITNLNTITLSKEQTVSQDAHLYSVSELAYAIDQNLIAENAYLTMPSNNSDELSHWHVKSGLDIIEENEPIFVYSRGYAGAKRPAEPAKKERQRGLCSIPKRGGGIVVGSQWLKGGIINGTCVMFDYPDTRNYFDFGLTNDQECLECIYDAVRAKTDNIILFGNCRGSKALLTYLSRSRPEDVKAVILDAPFMDLDQFTKEIGKNYGAHLPFSKKITKKIITEWHPTYLQRKDLAMDELKNIPTHIPIFIGHLLEDSLVSDQMIRDMVKILQDSGHIVYLLVIDDKTKSHSRLYQTKPFQQAVNAFLKQYDLPHDARLATEGAAMLGHAYYTAAHGHLWKKGFIHVFKA